MITTVIKPDSEFISIKLPHEFIGHEVEVIAFTTDETNTSVDDMAIHFASERVLAKGWLTPEEDAAWKDL